MIPVERIQALKIFRAVPSAALAQLARNMDLMECKKGAEICHEGDEGEGFFMVLTGEVAVEKALFHGDQSKKTVARLGPEQFFGEMAFLQNQPYSATVTAVIDSEVVVISRTALNDLANRDPKIALDQTLTMMTGLSDRLRSTTRELVTLFDVSRVIGLALPAEELAQQIVDQLSQNLSSKISIGFYKWNMFNDEYALLSKSGPNKKTFPDVWEPVKPLHPKQGYFLLSPIDFSGQKEGLLLYHADGSEDFSSGEKQLIETISAVLAPALSSARWREEEAARQRFNRTKQEERYS